MFIMALLGVTSHTFGQANPEVHKKGMQRLAFLEGTWGADTYKIDKNGDLQPAGSVEANDPDSTKLTSFKPIFNGNYYRITARAGYNFSMTIGYDQWRDTYVMVAFEDGPGLIDIYEGNFEADGSLVLTNFVSGTHYVQNGTSYYNRMVFTNVSKDKFTWFIDLSTDGNDWNRVARYDFKK